MTTGQVAEIDWLYGGAGAFYPEDWAAFVAGVPESMQQGDMVVAYHQLLQDPDPEVRYAAAARWTDRDLRTAVPSSEPVLVPPPLDDPEFQLTRARICTHYFRANLWLEDGVLLRNAGALEGIPATLITGRLDMQSPPARAWDLHQAWPGSELVLVDNVGHAPGSPSMFDAIVIATDQIARRLGPQPEPTPPTPSAATPAPAPAPAPSTDHEPRRPDADDLGAHGVRARHDVVERAVDHHGTADLTGPRSGPALVAVRASTTLDPSARRGRATRR